MRHGAAKKGGVRNLQSFDTKAEAKTTEGADQNMEKKGRQKKAGGKRDGGARADNTFCNLVGWPHRVKKKKKKGWTQCGGKRVWGVGGWVEKQAKEWVG